MAWRKAGFKAVLKFGGLIILILISVKLSFQGEDGLLSNISDEYNVYLVLTGTILALIGLLLTSGYKRLPFWVNLAIGLFFIVLSILPFSWTDLLNDGICILGGVILFLTAGFVSNLNFINVKLFSIVVPLVVFMLILASGKVAGTGKTITYAGELSIVEERIREVIRKEEPVQDPVPEPEPESANEPVIETVDERDETDAMYIRELELINQKISELEFENSNGVDIEQVRTMAEAVNPTSPGVRDFAVKLASAVPGSYYRDRGEIPSKEGIGQILAIHDYISGQWSYINDPRYGSLDYYSPAERTIGLDLAGDCDDFSILMASCIEAIGGKARILGGTCSEGGHAWCEVFIGDEAAWNQAVSQVRRQSPGASIRHIVFQGDRDYWLSLDWKAGEYSCGNDPFILYRTGGGK